MSIGGNVLCPRYLSYLLLLYPRELLSLWGLVFLYFFDINPHPGGLTASTLGGKCCG